MTKQSERSEDVGKGRGARLVCAAALLCLLCAAGTFAQGGVTKKTHTLALGETTVSVNVYEKAGARVTFFAPHYDERAAAEAARDAVGRRGGRLVEIVSYDDAGRPARRLGFKLGGLAYSIDPNRIYTEQGRRCAGLTPEVERAVAGFARALLELVFAPGGGALREGESFVVAVHNNADFDSKDARGRASDLTATAFVKSGTPTRGAFERQAAGVYLSNREADADNFVLLSTPSLIGPFAERGFNVVLQRPAAELVGGDCAADDGSLSVYSAQQGIAYVCLEADAASGGPRQREMLEAVYGLLTPARSAER